MVVLLVLKFTIDSERVECKIGPLKMSIKICF